MIFFVKREPLIYLFSICWKLLLHISFWKAACWVIQKVRRSQNSIFETPSLHVTLFSPTPSPCIVYQKVKNYNMTQKIFPSTWLVKNTSHYNKWEESSKIAVLNYVWTLFTQRYTGIKKPCWQNSGVIILRMW